MRPKRDGFSSSIWCVVTAALVLAFSGTATAGNKSEQRARLSEKYGGLIVFSDNEYTAWNLVPTVVDGYLTGGKVTQEWATENGVRLGVKSAEFLAENLQPGDEVHAGIMTFRLTPEFLGKEVKNLGFNKFEPYVAIKRKGRAQDRASDPLDLSILSFQNLGKSPYENWYLDIDGNTGALMLTERRDASGILWQPTLVGDGVYTLQNLGRSRFEGAYLDIDGNTGEVILADGEGTGTRWKITEENGKVKLQTLADGEYRGHYLDIDGNTGKVTLAAEGRSTGTAWKMGGSPR